MRLNNYKIVLWFMMVALSIVTFANDPKDYTGKVVDKNGEPIVGVAISNDQGKILTYSNEKGEFFVELSEDEKLNFYVEGFKSAEFIPNTTTEATIYLEEEQEEIAVSPLVNLPFGSLSSNRIVGAIGTVDVPNELTIDQRTGITSALNGKIAGLFNNSNVRGYGNAIFIVDGVPRDVGAYNLTQIETVTVLKDATARMLYGAQADQGVVLITTRRGSAAKKEFRARVEYGIQTPLQMPEFLDGAAYMEKFNEALANDGLAPLYDQTQIDNTRNGVDAVKYPDEDFYDSRFLNDTRSFTSANVDAIGGSDFGNYFVNLGFSSSNDYFALGGDDIGDQVFNARGSVDYKVSDILTVKTDVLALVQSAKTPIANYWNLASTQLPNAYPVFIPTNRVTNQEALFGAELVDGNNLLGGNGNFITNLYGEVDRRGLQTNTNRLLQFNAGLDFDFDKHIQGLSASATVSFDALNIFAENTASTYRVYRPDINLPPFADGEGITIETVDNDFRSTQNTPLVGNSYAHRRFGLFGTISYKKEIGPGDLDVTSLVYMDRFDQINQNQPLRNLHYGLRANYFINNKYAIEFTGAYQGSPKLTLDNQFAFSPSVGGAWIVSEEDFFGAGFVDFLKLKSSYGVLRNDNWDGNFLQEQYFSFGNNFNYNNGGGQNAELDITNLGSSIDWQKRGELNAGFEAAFLDSDLTLEVNYFRSESFDNVTDISSTAPALTGGLEIYENFNSDITTGIDVALGYTKTFGEVTVNVGSYFTYAKNEIDKFNEASNLSPNLIRSGTDGWSRIGLLADGLYAPEEVNPDGTLVSGITNSFGSVQAGDIKYIDVNGDNIIDNQDQTIIGSNFPSMSYSLKLDIRFKGFGFYALGTGNSGSDGYRSSTYFWVFGDRKYSNEVLQAYGPNNQNVNAVMPRLSTSQSNNNYRQSSYWLYENNSFNIPIIQLSYTYDPGSEVFKNLTLFLKGNNLVRLNKNKEWADVRVGQAPLNQGFSIGLTGTF